MTLAQFIESQEGREHKAYKDANGYSIGVGHFLTKAELASGLIGLLSGQVEWKNGLTDAQIDELLEKDIENVLCEIQPHLKVNLTRPQFYALVDFVFNLGIGAFASSTLLKKINAGITDETSIRTELDKWVFSQGLVIEGLKNRRKLEGDIWCGKLQLD